MVLTGKMRAGRPRSRGLVGTCGRVARERGPLARILDAGTVLTGKMRAGRPRSRGLVGTCGRAARGPRGRLATSVEGDAEAYCW